MILLNVASMGAGWSFKSTPFRSLQKRRADVFCLRMLSQQLQDETSSDEQTTRRLKKIRCRARIAYDGSCFSGFQIQTRPSSKTQKKKQPRTVQGELERVLTQRFSGQRVRVLAAGRTDAGVHARGQAIHFDLPIASEIDMDQSEDVSLAVESFQMELPKIQRAVERMLPHDLAFWNLQIAPGPKIKILDGQKQQKAWSAMYDSTLKWYSYRLHTGPAMYPLQRHNRWHPNRVQHWFDAQEFERFVKKFQGTHDFRAFAGNMNRLEQQRREYLIEKNKESKDLSNNDVTGLDDEDLDVSELEDGNGNLVNTMRTVRLARLVKEPTEGEHCYRIDFFLEGALYKQVRNMVGAIVEVCRDGGRLTEEDFDNLLENPTRMRADNLSKPAPPQGLTLEQVYFEIGEEKHWALVETKTVGDPVASTVDSF
eukprot:CAMPEP_0172468046 /NCGR_PEP_ID=MMETSP1065-20121228/60521_1 /TAXON_ID=265537 /ORGANISM="Amphiprora paludosa, Strain CCMP125" /LENGTH=424 /DNA_ID=CAMNT_0013225365 /DNA_START=124 /DNA_END=1398 /DNA_ORIENTATION=+